MHGVSSPRPRRPWPGCTDELESDARRGRLVRSNPAVPPGESLHDPVEHDDLLRGKPPQPLSEHQAQRIPAPPERLLARIGLDEPELPQVARFGLPHEEALTLQLLDHVS